MQIIVLICKEISDLIASITFTFTYIKSFLILKINPFIILSALSYFIDSKNKLFSHILTSLKALKSWDLICYNCIDNLFFVVDKKNDIYLTNKEQPTVNEIGYEIFHAFF